MTATSVKWTIVSILTIALVGWLLHLSLGHAALAQMHREVSKLRDAQIQTISKWNELEQNIRTARDRAGGEHWSLKYALRSFEVKGISNDLLKSFLMPYDNYALYTSNDIGSGFLLLPDEESEVVVHVRTLIRLQSGERAVAHLKQTLESPDSRIILPVKSNHLTEYVFDTFGSPGELKFGCRLTDIDGTKVVPICDVEDSYEASGSDGPYNEGVFKNREHEITYGWPELSDLSFVKTLQERGIWLIARNDVFRPANRPSNQLKALQVVLVFASKREWRVHPDYLYSRSLSAGFDLEWDPQQQDYLATPKSSK